MNQELSKKQRWYFFGINVSAFAIVFLLLGFIILQLLNQSAYRQTDLSLNEMAQDQHLLQMEIARFQQNDPFLKQPDTNSPSAKQLGNRFNTQIVLWSQDGEILNKDALGGRFNELQTLTLDTNNLQKITPVAIKGDQDNTAINFRSITIKADVADSQIAYIQILANTDQIASSMATFRSILVICMVIFWLLSIALSYYISKMNMRPIWAAWQKQQEFVENASHELRTPLTIIQNSLQRLFTRPDRTILEESETIAQALNETRRLTGLTSDLLTIARSDSNQLIIEKNEITPNDFIQQLVKPFQEIAEMEEKQFVLENLADRTVSADEKKLHQVLVILLDNALKYTDKNDTILLHSEIINDAWLIEVKNTGPSISDSDKKQIFERFYREDRSRSKETGGYGLGLAIAKQIVTEHKGKITVHDWQPRGVVFQIRLPKAVV